MFSFQHRGAFVGLVGLAAVSGGCSARVRTASLAIRYELTPEQTTSIEPDSLRVGPIEVDIQGPSAGGYDSERWGEIATQMLARRLYGDAVDPRSRGDETGGWSGQIKGTIHVTVDGVGLEAPANANEESSQFVKAVFSEAAAEVPNETVEISVRSGLELVHGGNGNKSIRADSTERYAGIPQRRPGIRFGSGIEATLDPSETVMALCVEEALVDFIARLARIEYDFKLELVSSTDPECADGVKAILREDFDGAVVHFESALKRNSEDERAAFCTGAVCEALGRYEDALRYYRRADTLNPDAGYGGSIDRVERFGVRKGAASGGVEDST